MWDALKSLMKQPYWVIALLLGVALIVLSSVTFGKDPHWTTTTASIPWLRGMGIGLAFLSAGSFGFSVLETKLHLSAGLDLTRVKENNGILSTKINGCEIRCVNGRIENYGNDPNTVVVLPCNEYFDDDCAGDMRSALGAYVNKAFPGHASELVLLAKEECKRRFGEGVVRQKTDDDRATSFGAGKCILLIDPLDRPVRLALVSTTTQRQREGLSARITYLFDGMRELVARLADERLTEVVMPILGAGHGRIEPPLAFVSVLLAVGEAARYCEGGHTLRSATIIVFKKDSNSSPEVDPTVVRRALAIIGSRD